jgi:hypothetical protein
MEFSYGTKKWKSKGVYESPKEEDESASTIETKSCPFTTVFYSMTFPIRWGIASCRKALFLYVERYNESCPSVWMLILHSGCQLSYVNHCQMSVAVYCYGNEF